MGDKEGIFTGGLMRETCDEKGEGNGGQTSLFDISQASDGFLQTM